MAKIAFMGAGSTVFAKNILGDVMRTESLKDSHIALYDIDRTRLEESRQMLDVLNRNINESRAEITAYLGKDAQKDALRGAAYVVNAIQVGGYEPSTVIDFEVPKKYGLRQTIGDTLGIGGIFRGLRTIPEVLDFARDMEEVCPDAWFINYVNPLAMITGALLLATSVKAVGLCHSVQGCARGLLRQTGLLGSVGKLRWKIAGINHQSWLLEIADGDRDLYPEIKKIAAEMNEEARKSEAEKHHDMVRFEIMNRFGFYVTESSEHSSEYMPYWIKGKYPHLIDEFNIPLDEYPRRCIAQIEGWKKGSKSLVENPKLTHERTTEYGSYIMDAIETDVAFRIHGNILNNGFITNLPRKACVEIPCLVDRNGVQGCVVGDLPEQCAALNRTNVNVHLLTIEAALHRKKEKVYQAALMDPHTAGELSIDEIVSLCDDMIEAHGSMLPKFD
jgi:alpha-galactosidase